MRESNLVDRDVSGPGRLAGESETWRESHDEKGLDALDAKLNELETKRAGFQQDAAKKKRDSRGKVRRNSDLGAPDLPALPDPTSAESEE